MPVPLELARESAESLRRLGGIARGKHQAGNGARTATSFARYTLARVAECREVWQDARERFRDGLEGGEARLVLGVVLGVQDAWLDLAESVTRMPDLPAPTRTQLEEARSEIERRKAEAERLLLQVSTPRPLNAVALETALREAEKGSGEDTQAIIARLQAGGEP
jgi:hypothetical protein